MNKKIVLTVVCLLLAFLQACKKDATQDFPLSDPRDFSEYISAFTTGMISSKSPIDIVLTKNWGEWEDQQEVDAKLVTISPAVKGKLHYLANQTLRFEPAERLKQDQKYYITFHLGKLTSVEQEKQAFSFLVHTVPQQFTTELTDLQSTDKDSYLQHGVIKSSDWTTTETIKKIATAQQEKKELSLLFKRATRKKRKNFHLQFEGLNAKRSLQS